MAGFSWKRAFKHAAIPFFLVIVAGGVLAATTHVADPEKLGEGTGQLAAFLGAVGLGASYLAQTGRKTAAIVLSVGIVALIGLLAGALVEGFKGHPKLSARDRMPLVEVTEGGERRLRHPTLGFSLRHPGEAFKEAPQFASMLEAKGGGDDTMYYAYADAQPTAVLIIGIGLERVESIDDLAKTVDGIESGIRESAKRQTPGAKLEIVERTIGWHSGRDARLHVVLAGAHMRLHVVAMTRKDGPPYVVILGAMSQSPDALESVIGELRRE